MMQQFCMILRVEIKNKRNLNHPINKSFYNRNMEAIATKLNITDAIKALIDEMVNDVDSEPSNAQEINCGLCEEFASTIGDQVEGAYMSWGDQLYDDFWGMEKEHGIEHWSDDHAFGHCFIIFEDRYYDSEAPKGVDHPKNLPFYLRRLEYALKYIDETEGEFWARMERENPENCWED